MKVYEFGLENSDDWTDWIVAENEQDALRCLRNYSDLGDIEYDHDRTMRVLSEDELHTLKLYESEDDSYDETTPYITFAEAIKKDERKLPYPLCSQIN